nr:hypothetical protein [Tanacetum cinerariifolium]
VWRCVEGGDEVSESEGESDEEETRQEEDGSFDQIPRTPEGSEDESNDEDDQELRLNEEARIQEEEKADELYHDVNINQGRGLQVTQNVEDSHVTLTPVNPDGPQESSLMSLFVTSMLNPTSDVGVESIFTTASSLIVSLKTPTPIMTPSTIATITTSSEAPIPPPTIPSIILENLPTFNSAFRFDERLRSLETSFSEYRQTNPFVDAVSAIPENDEFLRNIDENMKKIIKGQVKNQVKEQVSRILPRIEESVNATLEAEVLTRSSHSSRTSYAIAADLSEMELKKILIEKMEGNKSIQRSDKQRNLYKELVKAYDADKAILDIYGESTILKRRQEEEEADELYRDVNINQGRGLQVTQNIEDSHVILTPVHPDGPQESSSMSSFVTSMLNPISDVGVESIFMTASSPIVSLQTPTPIMTPSTIATITTSRDAPIPPTTIPSIIIENLPTFNSAFHFDKRLRSLENTLSEYRQTNLFVDVVSAILDIVNQYMTQQMTEAVREAVQIQTDRLQDSLQLENDEFLHNIDENMKKIIKGQVKSQVKEQVSRILPRIEESVNATLEAEVLTRSSHSSRTSYAIAADLSEMELKKILIEKVEGNKSIQQSDEQRNLYKALVEAFDADKAILDTYGESTILKQRREDDDKEGPSAGSDRGSKRQKEGGESAVTEEPVQTTCQMEEPSHPVFETGVDDQPIVQTSQHPEWFSQPRRPPLPDRDWNKTLPVAQGDAQS